MSYMNVSQQWIQIVSSEIAVVHYFSTFNAKEMHLK